MNSSTFGCADNEASNARDADLSESVHYLSMKEQDNQKDIHNSEMQEAGGDQSDHLEIPSQSKDDTLVDVDFGGSNSKNATITSNNIRNDNGGPTDSVIPSSSGNRYYDGVAGCGGGSSRTSSCCDASSVAVAAAMSASSCPSLNNNNNSGSMQPPCCSNSFMNHSLSTASNNNWQLFSVTLHRAHPGGFGIAVVSGSDCTQPSLSGYSNHHQHNHHHHNNCCASSIIISDVIPSGPAFGLLQVNDHIISANGFSLEHADYAAVIAIMKEAEHLNMIVKRRVPVPFVEFEQRTLKFTLSKSHKRDDFGIVLGCRYYIKEITNPKLAEKDPGLKEGDSVLRINGQSLEQLTLDEATRLLHRSREKLSLVVQRDVRRCPGNSRWPSQTTVYERLGSVSATPRQSPTPVHYSASLNPTPDHHLPPNSASQYNADGRKISDHSQGMKRFSDSVLGSPRIGHYPNTHPHPSPLLLQHHQQHYFQNQQHRPPSNDGTIYDATGRSGGSSVAADYQQPPSSNYHSSQQPSPHSSVSSFAQGNNNNHQRLYEQRLMNSPHLSAPHFQQNISNQMMSMSAAIASPYRQHHPHMIGNQYGTSYNQGMKMMAQTHPTAASINNANLAGGSSASSSIVGPGGNYEYFHPKGALSNSKMSNDAANTSTTQRVVRFCKENGSLGIRVIGGNKVGIFVSVVQKDSLADKNGIRVGDRLLMVNGRSLKGVTREEAVEYLMALEDEVVIHVDSSGEDFLQIKGGQMGDSFYIRTHFAYQKRVRQEVGFHPGDIFHVTDTLVGGSVGHWQAIKVYSANETEINATEGSGIIPNMKEAETLAKQSRMDASTLGRSLFRKKLQSHRTKSLATATGEVEDDGVIGGNSMQDISLPAYERVALKKPSFCRPIVLFGPLADVARDMLLMNHSYRFGAVSDGTSSASTNDDPNRAIRMSSIDAIIAASKHCVLNISPGSVERLQLAQYAPIVVLIDVDSRSRIRELRSKAGVATSSARKMMEEASKVKKQYAHLLTATLDATREDAWFEALRHLIFHLQERRVWMPEFQPTQPIDDILLFPSTQGQIGADETSKVESIYDATTGGLGASGSGISSSVRQTPTHNATTRPNDLLNNMVMRGADYDSSGFGRNTIMTSGNNGANVLNGSIRETSSAQHNYYNTTLPMNASTWSNNNNINNCRQRQIMMPPASPTCTINEDRSIRSVGSGGNASLICGGGGGVENSASGSGITSQMRYSPMPSASATRINTAAALSPSHFGGVNSQQQQHDNNSASHTANNNGIEDKMAQLNLTDWTGSMRKDSALSPGRYQQSINQHNFQKQEEKLMKKLSEAPYIDEKQDETIVNNTINPDEMIATTTANFCIQKMPTSAAGNRCAK